jgi:hypothetical protein
LLHGFNIYWICDDINRSRTWWKFILASYNARSNDFVKYWICRYLCFDDICFPRLITGIGYDPEIFYFCVNHCSGELGPIIYCKSYPKACWSFGLRKNNEKCKERQN